MKKLLFVQAACIAILLTSAFSAHSQCLSGWKYFMPLTIKNNVSTDLKSYQVKVTLNSSSLINIGKMNSTGDDIRFVDPKTCKALYYWIESGINTANTVIWIKMPILAGSNSKVINMYYGNSSSAAASNGDSTFAFFDGFDGSALNTSKWGAFGQSGTVSVSGGALNISTPSSGRYYGETIVSNGSVPAPVIVEENLISLTGHWSSLAMFNSGTYDGYSSYGGNPTSSSSEMDLSYTAHDHSAYGCHVQTYVNNNPGTIAGIWQISWPATGSQTASWPGGSFVGTNSVFALGSSVQIGTGMTTESNGNLSIDWIRARGYASKEPNVSFDTEVSNKSGISTPTFTNSINVYPNPTHDKLNIDLKDVNSTFESLQLMDINGKVMQTMNVVGQNGVLELSTNSLTKGMYFIKMSGKDQYFVQKIAVE
jgi:hypothetical protein